MNPSIVELAAVLYESFVAKQSFSDNHTSDKWVMELPIEAIDNIRVTVTLSIWYNNNHSYMKICANNVWKKMEQKTLYIDVVHSSMYASNTSIMDLELFTKSIHSAFTILPKLKYEPLINKFTTSTKVNTDALLSIFKCDTIQLKLDECCVCKEQTLNKTCCNHYLCISCWQQVKDSHDEEGICSNEECQCHYRKKCPYCRGDMEGDNEEE
jgi:hypothetical protein